MVTLKVLGSLRVEIDGRAVDAGGRLARMVLVQLLVARGAAAPTERIIERLWPTRIPSSAQASLHAYIARLRRVLEPERAPRTPARLLISAPYGYALALEPDARYGPPTRSFGTPWRATSRGCGWPACIPAWAGA
ncbi:winged helix-turn-helix domain-containing protein [Streptomyces sp. NBC_00211]|uniref:AfsR/SARP family transcriptional regulator n=1 Tax=Streptomyces sp. NBC_00211 TaxID=2975683 RepID=UPI00325602B6